MSFFKYACPDWQLSCEVEGLTLGLSINQGSSNEGPDETAYVIRNKNVMFILI